MIKNYFKTAVRNLLRNRSFTILNILGLVIGISGAIVIFKVISFENSFDRYHSNGDRVYRLAVHQEDEGGIKRSTSVQHPLRLALKNEFPDALVSGVHFYSPGVFEMENAYGVMKRIRETRAMAFVDQSFFDIFDYKIIAGNGKELLTQPNTIAISASAADKLFELKNGEYQSVLGRTVKFENQLSLQITGVYADPPKNTDYGFHYLMFYEGAKIYPYANGLTSWGTINGATSCLIQLPAHQSEEAGELALKAASKKYLADLGVQVDVYYMLQPLGDIHMSEEYNKSGTLDQATLRSLKIIGLILILTAAINFINLATAQSVKRAKEIGIRKVLGSKKSHLVIQFLGEVFLITLMAVMLSLGASEAALMQLEPFLGYSLGLNMFSSPEMWVFLILLVLAVTFLSGLYPAFVLSNYNPIIAIKGNKLNARKRGNMSLRRVLVVIQFFISQALIIGTLVVLNQMSYMTSKPLGFKTEGILSFEIPDRSPEKLQLLKSRLSSIPSLGVLSMHISSPGAANTNNVDKIKNPNGGEGEAFSANRKDVDENYAELFDLTLIAGEFYKNTSPRDYAVVNRKLVNQLGFTNPQDAIGQYFETNWGTKHRMVGVVEDFHNLSLHNEMDPIYMQRAPSDYFEAGVQIKKASQFQNVIDLVERVWTEVFPEHMFTYDFIEDRVKNEYAGERRISELFEVLAGMAIFICCLGLYGLISFMANQKTKEIGIRKVLGAKVSGIMMIFSKEVALLVLVAFVLAVPLMNFVMNNWLDTYVYHINLGAQIFVVAIFSTFLIAAVTVGFRAFRAAVANPINSLRDE